MNLSNHASIQLYDQIRAIRNMWPKDGETSQFWATPAGRPGPFGQYWQLRQAVRNGMSYREFPIMGGPVPEESALRWLQQKELG